MPRFDVLCIKCGKTFPVDAPNQADARYVGQYCEKCQGKQTLGDVVAHTPDAKVEQPSVVGPPEIITEGQDPPGIVEEPIVEEPIVEENDGIYELELNEEIKICDNCYVRRVPGGWIYTAIVRCSESGSVRRISSTFVPWNGAFGKKTQ